jgi:hypothetical protein
MDRAMALKALVMMVLVLVPAACTSIPPLTATPANACPITEPAWLKPPEDAAVQNEPAFGHYLVNADRSIWASAWWTGQDEFPLRATADGNKIGWFRPAGAPLEITGKRMDAPAPPLKVHVPCCYPTQFQSSVLYFPTEGCWKVTARAAESEIVFVVRVEP